jgi:hypothetical protein
MSHAFVYGSITEGQLSKVLDSLRLLHQTPLSTEPNQRASMYGYGANYLKDMWARNGDEAKKNVPDSNLFIQKLLVWLELYETGLKGT